MPAVTTAYQDLLSTKFQRFLINVGKEKPLLYPRVIKVEDMEVNPYISDQISGMGAMNVKPEGQQFPNDLPIAGSSFQVTATPYGMLFSVTWEMWRDDKYGVMGTMWSDMGRSARWRQEVQAFSIFNNAFSVTTGYDATTLCSTSHTNLDGQTQSNRPSPDVVLSQAAIQAGQLNFRTLNDQRSRPLQAEPTRILIHPTNIPLARELLATQGKPASMNNDMNALLPDELSWIPSRYLTRTQDWFMMLPVEESDASLMWRDRPRSRDFEDPFIEAVDYTVYQRFATRVGAYFWVYGSTTGV